MRNIYKINRSNLWSRILVLWLLFSISVLVLSSCSNSRSVRNNNFLTDKKNKSEKKQKVKYTPEKSIAEKPISEEDDILIPEIKNFAKNVDVKKKSPSDEEVLSTYNANNSRIPTLREQMKSLSDEQQNTNSKINNLQNDVAEIKHTLNEIKNVLEDIETKPKSVYRGPDIKTNPEKSIVKNDVVDETFIVSADEEEDFDDETFFEKPVEPKPKAKKVVSKPVVKKEIPKSTEKKIVAPKKETEVSEKSASINEDFELAMKLYSEKNFAQAIEKFKSASAKSKDPNIISDCNYYLGECYFAQKDYNSALNFFNKSVNSVKSNKKDNAQLMIAEAHARSGKVDEAKSAYQNLIKNYPDSELIAKAKKMLQQL